MFYVTVGMPVAALADRTNRRNILVTSLALWSGMTAVCGLAQNYWQLLLARFAVGVGEAGGTPPSTSILADKFSPARRPMALTIFALGACLGAWLGSSVAGAVAERSGWRAAFLVLGMPGVAVAFLVWLTVREPRRGQLDDTNISSQPGSLVTTLRFVAQQRSAVHLILGGSVATFWSWGLMWWTPTFLQRSHHLSVGQAGALLGPMHLYAGTAGTLLAGWLMSRRIATDPRNVTTPRMGDRADDSVDHPLGADRKGCDSVLCGCLCRRCISVDAGPSAERHAREHAATAYYAITLFVATTWPTSSSRHRSSDG